MQLNGGNYGGWIFNQEELTITQQDTGEQVSCSFDNDIIEIQDALGTWRYNTHVHAKSLTADFVGMGS